MNKFTPLGRTPGICDRCGQQYKRAQLRTEFVLGKPTGVLVCPKCWDEDHPQNYVGFVDAADPEAIRDPRAEDETQSREITHPTWEEMQQ
jgi:hypothetical protein